MKKTISALGNTGRSLRWLPRSNKVIMELFQWCRQERLKFCCWTVQKKDIYFLHYSKIIFYFKLKITRSTERMALHILVWKRTGKTFARIKCRTLKFLWPKSGLRSPWRIDRNRITQVTDFLTVHGSFRYLLCQEHWEASSHILFGSLAIARWDIRHINMRPEIIL